MRHSHTSPAAVFCIAIALITIALAPAGIAQTTSNQQQENESSEPMDEIVVTSEKTISMLRFEVRVAEKQVFDMFNEFNTDPDFDVDCGRETRRDLVSWDWACRPNYETTLRSEARVRMINGGANINASERIKLKHRQLRKKMEDLMRKRPEFLQSLLKLADATEALEQEREKRCKGRIICRRPTDGED